MKGFIKRDSMVPTHSDTKDLKPTCIHRMGTSCLRSKCLGGGLSSRSNRERVVTGRVVSRPFDVAPK